jgi:hypothetical protein
MSLTRVLFVSPQQLANCVANLLSSFFLREGLPFWALFVGFAIVSLLGLLLMFALSDIRASNIAVPIEEALLLADTAKEEEEGGEKELETTDTGAESSWYGAAQVCTQG